MAAADPAFAMATTVAAKIGTDEFAIGILQRRRDLGGIIFAEVLCDDQRVERCVVSDRALCAELRSLQIGDKLSVFGTYQASPKPAGSIELALRKIAVVEKARSVADDQRSPDIACADAAAQCFAGSGAIGRPSQRELDFLDSLDYAEIRAHLRLFGVDVNTKRVEGLEPALRAYGMNVEAAFELVASLPTLSALGARGHAERFFRDVWKLLSNDTVAACGYESGWSAYRRLVRYQVLTHHDQLRYIDATALATMISMLERNPQIQIALKQLLANSGGQFSNVVNLISRQQTLANDVDNLLAASRARMTTPLFFRLFQSAGALTADIERRLRALAMALFTDRNVQELLHQTAEYLGIVENDSELLNEVLYWFHRPPNHSFTQFNVLSSALHRSTPSACFISPAWKRSGPLLMRAGRSRYSMLTRASAGICTASETSLDARNDHAHIDLFDLRSSRVAGNVQLYHCTYDGLQSVGVRAINPSVALIEEVGADALLEAIFDFCIDIASAEHYGSVVLLEPLGVLNVETARREIRFALSRCLPEWKQVRLSDQIELFRLCQRQIKVAQAFEIWKSGE